MDITLKQLQVFTAIARNGNLTQAADSLFMTKGAVSQSLQGLERRLGVLLFDRKHPKLSLNHEGMRLLPMADEIVQRAQDIENTFLSDSSEEASGNFLLVGCSQTIGNYVMPKLMAGFSFSCGWLPDVRIANTRDILTMLSDFSLDVGLLEGDERIPDIIFEPWITDEMVVIAHPEHPLVKKEKVSLQELSGERWIVREMNSGSRDYFTNTLGPLLGEHAIAMTLSSPAVIVESVAQGLGIAFVSSLSAALFLESGRLGCIPLDRRFPRTFSLGYHTRKYQFAGMRRFLTFCREQRTANTAAASVTL